MAHARLTGVDVSAALEHPEVVAAFSGEDLRPTWQIPLPASNLGDSPVPDHWPLTVDKVRHVGDPVAVVVATSRVAAADAVEFVDVDYDPLPAVPDVTVAAATDTLVHDGVEDNLAFHYQGRPRGDIDAAFAAADVVLRRRYVIPRLVPTSLEPRSVLAAPDPAGGLVVYTSTQIPHKVRRDLARCLGLDEDEVRVVAPDVGGGFGAKLNPYPEDRLCAALALRLGRPVRWTATRSEEFQATSHGRAQVQELELAARSDGTLLGLRVRVTADLGGYLLDGTVTTPMAVRRMLPGCYRWQAYQCEILGRFTTATPTDAYRGAGRPEASFGIERAIDDLAAELDLDPAELRRRNFPAADEFPFTTVGGHTYDSGEYEKALEAALELAGYQQLRDEQERRRAAGDPVLVGIGLSSYVEVCGFGPGDPEAGAVRVRPDGRVVVTTGLAPTGQGTATSLAQLAADALGVTPQEVVVVHGDTAKVPFGAGTYGSRSMPVGAPAVHAAASEVAEKAQQVAAHLLEADAADVELRDGRASIRGAPGRGVTLAEVAAAADRGDLPDGVAPGLEAATRFRPDALTFPFGTHVCVVEVDTETGRVAIRRHVAIDDVGGVVNPQLLDGQRHGGIAQGIAEALYEGVVYDADGNLLTGSLVDYLVPTAPDLPDFELERTVTPTPHNALGAKGAGEAGAIGAPPAVVNAVVDALRHLGVDHVEMPCTPQRVWEAIASARGAGG